MNRFKLLLFSLCFAIVAQAKVVLPSFFTDHMIVQQNSVLTIPGKTKAGKKVTVKASWDTQSYVVKADVNGDFRVEIPTPAAGGPYNITISDGTTLTLNNILSGEVWFCSGQSNMEMPVAGWGKVLNYEKEIAEANYPSIRLLQVKKTVAFTPQENVEMNMGGWQECSPATVPEFSSVAYFYARKLWQELNVPIGVIDCTWGGTPAEAWTSYQTLKQVMGFEDKMARMNSVGFNQEKLIELYYQEMDEWLQQFNLQDAGIKDGVPQWISARQTGKEWKPMQLPAYWETKGLNFDGIVWFQKEVEIPVEWDGKEVSLSLAMIDDDDVTYFNGKEIGKTSGCNTMRNYKIPADLVKAGKGIITIRAIDYGGEGGIHGEPQNLFIEGNGKKISLAGDWSYHLGASMANAPSRPLSPEGTGWPTSCYPTALYNAMVHPFTVFPIKGVIWYQGEHNVGYDEQYKRLFPAMIADWRKAWKQDFPFYFVQLANYLDRAEVQPDSKWAALRQAQAEALHLKNTGMAVTIDIGEAHDIHPKNKQEVARRLAVNALAKTYHKNVSSDGPVFQSFEVAGNTLTVRFDEEILLKGSTPKGFIVAGPDGIFHPATATIQGKTVLLQSSHVEIPLAARYGWADNPECNLYGTNDLPVVPFRTDK
ncbi:sialate O-acetylesterase [Bacteroides sp. 51]|uniref:sialate O-acetylesterase n=1 Tax=Bacteroides sp. 51 TaxID=2302938 RepID=UPI0013D66E4A|nr:sialate O-acetylesterase [Bacteroides sp. 51]NDV80987.1 9-O-acetylesterase [Bacteroides sp. 51]